MKWLVVGSTRGIGKAICCLLNKRKEGEEVLASTREDLDLSDLESVLKFTFPVEVEAMVLVAGVQGVTGLFETKRTKDGFDQCFQVNFLSHAILVHRFSQMKNAKNVIYLSSEAVHNIKKLDGSRLLRLYRSHSKLKSYAASKALFHIFASKYPLVRCANPGHVETGILDELKGRRNIVALVKRSLRKRLPFITADESAKRVLDNNNELELGKVMKNVESVHEYVHGIISDFKDRGIIRKNKIMDLNSDHVWMAIGVFSVVFFILYCVFFIVKLFLTK